MYEKPDLSPPSIAKWLITSYIAMKVGRVTAQTIDNHTPLEKDSTPVQLGSGLVGMLVSAHAKPYTDKMVDKTSMYIAVKRVAHQNKKNKKNAKKQEKK